MKRAQKVQPWAAGFGAALCLLGCGKELQINLIVYDPCNQSVLAEAQHIQVQVASPDLSVPQENTFSAGTGQGELPGLPLVDKATVSVLARAANGAGGPGVALGAADVGILDLTGQAEDDDDLVELAVAVGRVDAFANTTDTRDGRSCTSLLAARQGQTATLLDDGRVFVAGGERVNTNSATYWESTELYDPRNGLFQNGPTMGGWTRKLHTATKLKDGRVLLAGGIGLGDNTESTWRVAQLFDPIAKTFLPPMQQRDQRANHTATLMDDGKVLLVGGTYGNQVLSTTEIFDPDTLSFAYGPVLREPRSNHRTVRVGPATVAVIGGRGSGQVLSTIEFITIGQTSTVVGPELDEARTDFAAVVMPGQDAIVVAGGFDALVAGAEFGTGLDSIEIIKLVTNNLAQSSIVCAGETLSARRGVPGAALVAGEALVVGGIAQPGQVSSTADRIRINNLASCDIQVGLTSGPMSTPRAMPVLAPLAGGDLLVTGGFTFAGGNVSTQSQGEIYVRSR